MAGPRDALVMKGRYIESLKEEIHHGWLHHLVGQCGAQAQPEDYRRSYDVLLRLSQVFYVGPDMVDLAFVAQETFPIETLLPSDLPAEDGFMWFGGRALACGGGTDDPQDVHGVTWVSCTDPTNGIRGVSIVGLWDKLAKDQGAGQTEAYHVEESRQLINPRTGRSWYDDMPRLVPVYHRLRGLGRREDDVDTPADLILSRFLATTWRLMQQPITTLDRHDPDHVAAARLERAGAPVEPVTVIQLRRQVALHDGDVGDGTRRYNHRWPVRGHWRQQPYKEDGEVIRRAIYINPYIKGPEDAPLLVRDRVYAWTR
jgi:hypothetical protein